MIAWFLLKLRMNFTRVFKVSRFCGTLKTRMKLILNFPRPMQLPVQILLSFSHLLFKAEIVTHG